MGDIFCTYILFQTIGAQTRLEQALVNWKLAQRQINKADWPSARASLVRVLLLYPRFVEGLCFLAEVHINLKDDVSAEKSYYDVRT